MTGGVKLSRNILLDKISQWNNNIQVIKNKLVVKICKTQEELDILDFLRLWPVLNNLYFVIGYGKTRRRKDISQILY